MKVSIIIPVYNAEKYLNECLESALNQTYENIEIIAVNDGSTDKSLQILNKFSNKIKIISKSNGGTASALNEGINHMSGEWFKWLSADDSLYPNAVEELILESKKLENSKNCIFYSNYDIINSESKVIKQFIEPNYNELSSFDFNTLLLDHYIGNGTTSLIHKTVLDENGFFDETIKGFEDYELWLRFCLLNNCRLHLIPKILAKYRVHKTQLTSTLHDDSIKSADKIRENILAKLDSSKREKFEIALKQVKKKMPLGISIKLVLKNIMFRVLPNSISKKFLLKYRELKYGRE